MKPIISIVGRPNVGKSTLFNRLLGYRKAITEDTPGVTRDRNYGEFECNGEAFTLVDTGGFEPTKGNIISGLIKRQIELSIAESSAILFLLDGKDGLLPQDLEIADILRRCEKPVLYVINKLDSEKRELGLSEFFSLGVDTIYPISAAHGLGIYDILDAIWDATASERDMRREGDEGETAESPVGKGKKKGQGSQRKEARLKREAEEAQRKEGTLDLEDGIIRVALVGRPNTGKSSLTNRLLGSERMIVSDVPGTTRDSIDSRIIVDNREFILIDTAGLRRKSRVEAGVEGWSVSSALNTIDRAHVVNLIIDGQEGVSHQDAAIAHTVIARGRGLCLVVNKTDLLSKDTNQQAFKEMVYEKIPHATFAPLVFTSALTGKNVERIISTDISVYNQLQKRIATPALNKNFAEFIARHSIPQDKGKQVKIFYANQVKAGPPTFFLFSNLPDTIPDHYKRYLENCLRQKYGFTGAPIRLVFRKK